MKKLFNLQIKYFFLTDIGKKIIQHIVQFTGWLYRVLMAQKYLFDIIEINKCIVIGIVGGCLILRSTVSKCIREHKSFRCKGIFVFVKTVLFQ